MTNILNLALKKEVFEGLVNKTNNEIPIEKSNWWKKRLMDSDTGRFKQFDIAKVSCGSPDKLDFNIVKIEERKKQYVVIVSFDPVVADLEEIEEKPVIDDEGVVTNESEVDLEKIQEEVNKKFLSEVAKTMDEKVLDDTYVEPEFDGREESEVKNVSDNFEFKKRVIDIFNNFCSYEKVYITPTPVVQVRSTGEVLGTSRRIFMHRDFDMTFPYEDKKYVKYFGVSDDDFCEALEKEFENIMVGNIVFVKKDSLHFNKLSSGEDVVSVKIATKNIYIFR